MEGRAPEKRAEEGRDADDGTTANKTAITRRSERERQSGKSKSRRMASAGKREKEEKEEDKVLRRALLFPHSQSVGRASEDIR